METAQLYSDLECVKLLIISIAKEDNFNVSFFAKELSKRKQYHSDLVCFCFYMAEVHENLNWKEIEINWDYLV